MVSKASDDFPDPERPVKTISFSRGSSSETVWRLCSRAPRMTSLSDTSREYRCSPVTGRGLRTGSTRVHDEDLVPRAGRPRGVGKDAEAFKLRAVLGHRGRYKYESTAPGCGEPLPKAHDVVGGREQPALLVEGLP